MDIFKRNGAMVNVGDVYVATVTITSSYDDGSHVGPKYVTWYYLVKREKSGYYELFAGQKIEKKVKPKPGDVDIIVFDTPYITRVEPLTKYLRNQNEKKVSLQKLMDFITNMNVRQTLGAFDEK